MGQDALLIARLIGMVCFTALSKTRVDGFDHLRCGTLAQIVIALIVLYLIIICELKIRLQNIAPQNAAWYPVEQAIQNRNYIRSILVHSQSTGHFRSSIPFGW